MQFHPLEAAKLKDQNMSRRDTYILLSKLYNKERKKCTRETKHLWRNLIIGMNNFRGYIPGFTTLFPRNNALIVLFLFVTP